LTPSTAFVTLAFTYNKMTRLFSVTVLIVSAALF
jgi:hypothetical protein